MTHQPNDSPASPGPDDTANAVEPDPATNPPGDAATPPPPAPTPTNQKPGLWQRWRGRQDAEPEPRASKCVIMGPSASGKTLLLMSLAHCADVHSHSYAERYTATVGDKNADFLKLESWLDRAFERGLNLDASDIGTCFRPEFTLKVNSKPGARWYVNDTRFSTYDGAGGLLEDDLVAENEAAQDCRKKLDAALEDCDTVLICLPIMRLVGDKQERALKERLHQFMQRRRIRQLVVCFTMYEMLALQPDLQLGRRAYREMATRTAARRHMAAALLSNRLSALNNVLAQFQERDRTRQIWCAPVSTYGFVPRNGGANLAQVGRRKDYILRTWPAPRDAQPPVPDPERPYEYNTARKEFWHPFLTLDPFVFIATGERRDTLIHSYDELWT